MIDLTIDLITPTVDPIDQTVEPITPTVDLITPTVDLIVPTVDLIDQSSLMLVINRPVSSAVYFFNDIFDAELDRLNPQKSRRPIASGAISQRLGYLCFGLLSIAAAALVMCYTLFAIDPSTKDHFEMALTVPLVLYGVFYYLYAVRIEHRGGAPDELLRCSTPILLTVLIYFVYVIAIRCQ